MNNKVIIIRCRANNRTGFGHLVRSRVLGRKFLLLGYKTILIGPNKKYMNDDDKAIFSIWIEREFWEDSDIEANFHIELSNKYNTKYIIMDDYRSNYKHQLLLRKAGLIILQQYDASKQQKFAANFVINGSPYERREFYEDLLYAKDIKMLHGPKYTILRDIFLDKKLQNIKKENKLLITFGGGDDNGAILFSIDAIYDYLPLNWKISIISGITNPNNEKIKAYIENNKLSKIDFHINPNNVPELIASSKLAILSGGTTTFESAYLGTPAILMPIAENQYNQGVGWSHLGAMSYLKPFNETKKIDLAKAIKKLILNEELLMNMSKLGRKYVDGNGANRIIKILLEEKL